MYSATKRRQYRGFTLIELLITVAVTAILISLAAPGFGEFIARNRMTAAVNTFIVSLQLARSEAVTRGENIGLCPSSNGATCLDSTEWHGGYIMRHGADVIRHIQGAADAPITIQTTTGGKTITYHPDGTSPGSNATYTFCDRVAHVGPRAVIISNVGRARTTDGIDSNCAS